MLSTKRPALAFVGLTAAALMGLTACGGSSTSSSPSSSAAPETSSMAPSPSASASESMGSSAAMDPASNLVGPGCAGYAAQVPDGAGSVAGMAQDPLPWPPPTTRCSRP